MDTKKVKRLFNLQSKNTKDLVETSLAHISNTVR